jgi:arylsulfatase A-like enzyme
MIVSKKPAPLLGMLTCLTLLMISMQISFFLIHYKVSDLVDSLVKSSLASQLYHSAIIAPLLGFLIIQIIAYTLFIIWTWFIAVSASEWFKLSAKKTYWMGITCWLIGCSAIISFNNYYFPDSFFSTLLQDTHYFNDRINFLTMIISSASLLVLMGFAYLNFFIHKRHLISGGILLFFISLTAMLSFYNSFIKTPVLQTNKEAKPNIIFIGLDSLRPDFINFLGHTTIHTPNVDSFLQSSTVFTKAYAPMARTFPSWISILTGKYPKHNNARSNLSDPSLITPNDNLAKRLKAAGYETIYGTDEKRFSNITEDYGFDHLLGPRMGVNDFLLGNLSDFPLSNLLINTPIGKFLFPFNYANRAAAITYEPRTFTQLVQFELAKKHDKPLFLAIHLCLSHWPYTWAHDGQKNNFTSAQRYQSSVEEVDQQLGKIVTMLKTAGLLDHAIVVLLSDHGTTLGLHNDRVISRKHFVGNKNNLKLISSFKLGTAPSLSLDPKKDYTIDTSYGQGTDVLSLKQNHILLAIKTFGFDIQPKSIKARVSLLDISPTILSLLNLKPLKNIDGLSLSALMTNTKSIADRPLYLESGYTISEIETNDIYVNAVLHKTIGAYQINPRNGFLFVKPAVEASIVKSKQRAILLGDWLLARYPAKTFLKLTLPKTGEAKMTHQTNPPYFVLVNLKTKQWTIGLSNSFAKKAPIKNLLANFYKFYGDELNV